jgi:ABC-2 type transport system permease protein
MRNIIVLFRKEVSSFSTSASACITMVVVLAVTGIGTFFTVSLSRGEPFHVDIVLFQPLTLWVMALVAATVLPMRLLAEEKKTGTMECLMTAPVTEVEVVLAKYAASLFVFLLIFAPTVSYVFIIRRFSSGVGELDFGVLVSGYLMFVLIGAFYLSIGLLVSASTSNQAVAALLSLAILFVLFAGGIVIYMLHARTGSVFEYVCSFQHILDSSRGMLDTRPIVLYLSGTSLALFATIKVIESRRWL